MDKTEKVGKQWEKFYLPRPSQFSLASWPLLARCDKEGNILSVTETNPLRKKSLNTQKTKHGKNSKNILKRLLGLMTITMMLLHAPSVLGADEPILLTLPKIKYPIQATKKEVAKFLNRCIDYEAAAIAVVNENNRIWRQHGHLVAAEEYNKGIAAADSASLQWYHWAAIIGGAMVSGAMIGFVTAVVVEK
jgi:hypothetical protein